MRLIKLLLLMLAAIAPAVAQDDPAPDSDESASMRWNHAPFAIYDTDVGFGAGYKSVLRNALDPRESFDLTLFASTKGERWVRIGVSWPDAELRQGSVYPLALDFVLDYDKMISNSFFGTGPSSAFEHRETYTLEPLEASLTASRGFTPDLVGSGTLRARRVWSYDFEEDGVLRSHQGNARTCDVWSVQLQLRHDTRTSVLRPEAGTVLQADAERALPLTAFAREWTRCAAWVQYYASQWDVVLATRVGVQALFGDDIPIQHLLPIGGNATVRGIPKDRFLDRASALLNLELRFPLWGDLGGIVGADAGAVAHDAGSLASSPWTLTPVAGLRYYLPTFVIRGDVGYSRDAVGVYFNFGQIF